MRLSSRGTIVDDAVGNAATRTVPVRRPTSSESSPEAASSAEEMLIAWRASTAPGSVRRTPRPARMTRGTPRRLSARRRCWLIAGWL